MKLVGYVRKSTNLQPDSLETQEAIIREYCSTHDMTCVRIYHEIPISGSSKIERRTALPELFTAMADKKRDFDGIIVVRLDRLFRNPAEEYRGFELAQKAKCSIISISDPVDRDTATGRLVHGIMSSIRAFERELTGERIYSSNLQKAMAGRWSSGLPPLGWDYDPDAKTLTPNARIDDVIRVFRTFIQQAGNASSTARALNAAGIVTRDGNQWRDDGVLTLVKGPIYRRQLRYDSYTGPAEDLIPETIPADLLALVDSILARKAPMRTRQSSTTYLYSGILTCSECGSRLKSTGNESNAWVCRAKKESGSCISRSVSNRYIDRLVGSALQKALMAYRDLWASIAPPQPHRRTKGAQEQRTRLETRRARTIESYLDGVIATREERDSRLLQVDAELALLDNIRIAPPMDPAMVAEWIDRCDTSWSKPPDSLRRELLTAIGARITVCTAREKPIWVEMDTELGIETVRISARHRNRKGGSP